MDAVLSFKTVIVIFVSGLLASLILGDFLTLLIISGFVASEFNLLNLIYTQLPEDLRDKYNSKLLIILEYFTEILKQTESRTITRSESSRELRSSKKRTVKDE